MQPKSKWYLDLVDRFLALETPQAKILEHRINQHLKSDELKRMIKAHEYYHNRTAIQDKKSMLKHRSNVKLELGQFRKLVKQKVGYLLSKPPSVTVEDKQTQEYLNKEVFDRDMLKVVKSLGQEAIIKGIAYSMVYLDEEGELNLFKVPTEQIIPFWSDERNGILDAFIRIYPIEVWDKGKPVIRTQVAYFDENGITYYLLDKANFLGLDPTYDGPQSHFYLFNPELNEVTGQNWDRAPLIAWRYNEDEASLLQQVETIIDNLALQASTSADLLADVPKFIYILKNYEGEDLDEFLALLNEYMTISVGEDGGVDKLQAVIDTTATENELKRNRKALYEAAAAIDTQDENLGNASGTSLKWRYTDLDLDMNDMEAEFQQSFEQFLWFVEQHAANNDIQINLDGFDYVFNRDMISNETEAITNAQNSLGILDDQTIREQHPWYSQKVEDRLEKQNAEYGIPPRPEYDDRFEPKKKVTTDAEEETD